MKHINESSGHKIKARRYNKNDNIIRAPILINLKHSFEGKKEKIYYAFEILYDLEIQD